MPSQLSFSFNKDAAEVAFRDFENMLERFTVKPTHKGGRSFVLAESLVNWLRNPWPEHPTCTQADRLHKSVYYDNTTLFEPISAEQLSSKQNGCLLVFSILLVLKRGVLVDRFQKRGIVDSQIPMPLERLQTRIKEMGLSDTDANKLAYSFYEKQFLFCPIMIFRNMDRYYDKEYIMPICQKQKINDKAGSATGIYLIEVQEQYVDEDLKAGAVRYEDKKDGFGYRYQFALKTFHQSNHQLFANEIQAFKALKDHEGMVQYLGEYTHEGHQALDSRESSDKTFNILLEYGDLDLDEYFLERLPPVFSTEIMRFWNDLFEVSQAIKGVHNLKHGPGDLAEDYYGWHADIKPDNILSVQGKFKLADPGFAHFIKKTDEIPMGEVLGGTETFGAPECHPSRRRSSTAVHQTIDIWSLACVFSIAATWVALGYQGILQYAEFRKNAIKQYKKHNPSQLGTDGVDTSAEKKSMEDYFHNSHEVLPEVTSWHKSLRGILRKTDTLTSLVLDLIDDKMLLSDPTKRLSAEETCIELSRIYKEAEEAQAKLENKVPEEITAALRQLDDSAPAKALPKTPSEESSPDLHSRNAKSKRLEVPLMKTTHRSEVFKPEPGRLAQRRESEARRNIPNMIPEDKEQDFHGQGVESTPLQHSSYVNAPLSNSQSTERPYSIAKTIDPSIYGTPPRRNPPPAPSTPSNKSRAPRQNVFEARQQLDQAFKGMRGIGRKLLGKQPKDVVLSSHFHNRDLLFLVDNGVTMKQYWSEATFLLETLVMKAFGQDHDGPDLMFTMGQMGLKGEKSASAFVEAMANLEAMPTGEVTDIRTSFGMIFDQYLKELEKTKWTHVPVKQLTIIVLTDGVWSGMLARQELDQQIKRFIRRVSELTHDVIPRRVSIEFIQFGKDPEATSHLRILDDLLKAPGVPDVIDTEPADGDVYKMLLGSFVDSYDEDEKRVELAESQHGTQETGGLYNAYSNHTSPSHASPAHDGPYATPSRTATETSLQTIRPMGPSHAPSWPLSEPSGRNHYGYP